MTLNPYRRFIDERTPREIIASTASELAHFLARISDSQCRNRHRPDKWSIAELICHLADTEIVFAFRIRQAISEDHHNCQTYDQDGWAKMYSVLDYRDALEVFTTLRKWNVHFISSLSADVYSKPFTHPERGTMTFGTLIETMAGHDLNHLEQIKTFGSKTAV
jgi:DinB family protein